MTGAVAIAEQKAFAEIEADRERLEVLAKKRVWEIEIASQLFDMRSQ